MQKETNKYGCHPYMNVWYLHCQWAFVCIISHAITE